MHTGYQHPYQTKGLGGKGAVKKGVSRVQHSLQHSAKVSSVHSLAGWCLEVCVDGHQLLHKSSSHATLLTQQQRTLGLVQLHKLQAMQCSTAM